MMEQNKRLKPAPSGMLRILFDAVKGILLLAFFLLILSFLIVFTDMPESMETNGVRAAVLLGAFFTGCFYAARRKSRGFLWGTLGGAVYALALWLLGTVLLKEEHAFSWLMPVLCVFLGTIGGMIGIRLRAPKKTDAQKA